MTIGLKLIDDRNDISIHYLYFLIRFKLFKILYDRISNFFSIFYILKINNELS
jgi:hypothetical protein